MLVELKDSSLGTTLTDEQLERISKYCRRETYPTGAQLREADDVLDKLYVIGKGCLKGIVEIHGKVQAKGCF